MEVKATPPQRPWAAKLAQGLRDLNPEREGAPWQGAYDAVVGSKPALLDRYAYGEGMTEGKGETMRLRPETAELLDVPIPPVKGAAAVGMIGKYGIQGLKDLKLQNAYLQIKKLIAKTDPNDVKLHGQIAESKGGILIPRGKGEIGFEAPEGVLTREADDIIGGSQTPRRYDLDELYKHDRLYKAYGDKGLNKLAVEYDPTMEHGAGVLDAANRKVKVGPTESREQLLGVINHEVPGHQIQRFEDWPGGTNPAWADFQLSRIPIDEPALPKEMKRQLANATMVRGGNREVQRQVAHAMYMDEAGEQLAEGVRKSAATGGGKVRQSISAPDVRLYDRRALDAAIQNYWAAKGPKSEDAYLEAALDRILGMSRKK